MDKAIIGVLLLVLWLGGGGKRRGPSAGSYAGMTGPEVVWPVPTYHAPDGTTYDATVSSAFDSDRSNHDGTDGKHPHMGLDIMYKRKSPTDRADEPPNVRGSDGFASTAGYFAPVDTAVLAVKPGKVWSVTERTDGGGWSIVVDHGKPWATYYTHIRIPTVFVGTPVQAGDMLGLMGGNMADSARVRHLHFEVWYDGAGSKHSVDVWSDKVTDTWSRR